MALLYKEDWEETKERFRSWWRREPMARCGLAVTAPRDQPPPMSIPTRPADPVARWTDSDYISALGEYRNAHTFFGGEAFPVWDCGYPGHKRLAVFLGCPITLDQQTGWLEPILTGDDIDVQDLEVDESSRWWRFTLEWLRRGATDAPGRSIPAVGAFGGCGDTLAAVRGTKRLLYDVMDRPEQVAAADQHLMRLWCSVYSRFYSIVSGASDGGSTCWFGLWAPGTFYAVHNDFAYMISPTMFRELFLPSLRMQTDVLDYSIFHVDGIGAFAHVEALCELPGLQAIQILPGAGKPSPLHYLPVLQEVQKRGKNLHITLPADQVQQALSVLSSRGLFIATRCASEGEARALLENAERWSCDRS